MLKLNVLSPERKLLDGETAEEVTLTGSEGQIQILPGHAPMIGTLETGVFSFRIPGKSETAGVISSGFFEVRDDVVTITAETLELVSEIDVARAKKAQQVSEDALKAADLDVHAFKKYQLKLQRSLIRQQAAGKSFGQA